MAVGAQAVRARTSKSLEVASEHVSHRGEHLVWPLDQHRRVKRLTDAEES